MKNLYYSVYINFRDGQGYSIPVYIETENTPSNDEVIQFVIKNELLSSEEDKHYIDSVTEIDLEDFNNLLRS